MKSIAFVNDPLNATDVVYGVSGMRCTFTLLAELPEGLVPDDFHVLRLDLSLSSNGVHNPSALVSTLKKAQGPVANARSKVLVTGDLNTSKSTLVNALPHSNVLPIDQHPLTLVFCEVHDALENDNAEEVPVISLDKVASYGCANPATFTCARVDDIETLQGDPDAETPPDYAPKLCFHGVLLLNNGIADITLIDAPGLVCLHARRKLTSLYYASTPKTTLPSAQEFLTSAAEEKAYVLIIINKYDAIRDKTRCKRRI
ncbi:mitofusin, partial [Ceratobasidium sp. 414]